MSMAVRGMSDCGPFADVPGCQRHHGNMTGAQNIWHTGEFPDHLGIAAQNKPVTTPRYRGNVKQ
jgi:hypothetical protein